MICEKEIEKAIISLPKEFICENVDENLWLVTTPFEYPDGDLIQLYVIKRDNYYEISDFAETIRTLKNFDFEIFGSVRREKMFQDILRSYNVEYFNGELKIKATTPEELTKAIISLSQAVFRVSDLIFTHRFGLRVTFKEEVEEILQDLKVSYISNYKIYGRSGSRYTIDFYLDLKKPDLVMTLATWSKSYVERLIDRVVRMFVDIQRIDGRFDYVSIVDDRSDVWKKEHFKLLEDFSEVYVWSEIDKFKERIIKKSEA